MNDVRVDVTGPEFDGLVAGGLFVEGGFTPLVAGTAVAFQRPPDVVDGFPRLQSPVTNLYSNSLLVGATPGLVGSGGALPTGWVASGASGWTVRVLEAKPGSVTLLVERAAGSTSGRIQIGLFHAATPPALGVAGVVSMSYRLEVLEADDVPVTVQSGPALASIYASGMVQEGGTGWGPDVPGDAVNVPVRWGGSQTRWHGLHTITATQYVSSKLSVEAQSGGAATYAIVRLSEFQIEVGGKVTGWAPRQRSSNALSVNVPLADATPVWALLAASPRARWIETVVSDGAIDIQPEREEFVRAVAVFDAKPSPATVGEALDILDPIEVVEYTRTSGVRRIIATGADGKEMLGFFESVTDEYLTTGAQTTTGPGPGHSLMTATNRDYRRFEMRPDEMFASAAHTEIYPYGNAAAYDAHCLPKASPHWASYWLRYTGAAPAGWRILGQWHQSNQATYNNGTGYLEPILSLGLMPNGDLTFDARVCVTPMPSSSSTKPTVTTKALRITQARDGITLLDGDWHHVLMKMVDRADGTGTAEVWVDGIKASGTGGSSGLAEGVTVAPCGYNVATGNVFQHGIYAGDPAHAVAEYSGLRWGVTDLSSQIANPPARL